MTYVPYVISEHWFETKKEIYVYATHEINLTAANETKNLLKYS